MMWRKFEDDRLSTPIHEFAIHGKDFVLGYYFKSQTGWTAYTMPVPGHREKKETFFSEEEAKEWVESFAVEGNPYYEFYRILMETE